MGGAAVRLSDEPNYQTRRDSPILWLTTTKEKRRTPMDDSINQRAQATAALAEMFYEKALSAKDLAYLEADAIDVGHERMTEALVLALEFLDAHLLEIKPKGFKVHDIRSRCLATEIGEVTFLELGFPWCIRYGAHHIP